MPIYEFYCRDCNTVFQFFSKRVNPQGVPPCPKDPAHLPLERMMSRFAMGRGGADKGTSESEAPSGPEEMPGGGGGMDDPAVEAKMMDLMSRMEGLDERDGRSMGRMMRELAGITGEGLDDPAMQETIRRLEAGEDPEKVEEIVSDAYGEEALGGGGHGRSGAPSYDESLYDM